MTRNTELVEVCGLTRRYGPVTAVDGIDFRFIGGQVHGFVGPNGAGKTTTMRIVATLEVPDAGDVLVDGVSVVDYPDQVRPVLGFMPDYLDLYRDMTVLEYLDFYARAYRLSGARRRRRLDDLVAFTGLESLLERPVEKLSKGERQRLGLGRLLVNDPGVLVLDEPAAGLDPRARIELRTLLRRLADMGKAVLVSSHILTELAEICDAVTIIDQGRIRASDTIGGLRGMVEGGVRVAVQVHDPRPGELEHLELHLLEQPGVVSVAHTLHGVEFVCQAGPVERADILAGLVEGGFRVTDFHVVQSDLEDAFLHLTGEGEA